MREEFWSKLVAVATKLFKKRREKIEGFILASSDGIFVASNI